MSESYEVVFQQVAAGDLYALLEFIEMDSQALSGLAVSEDIGRAGPSGDVRSLIDTIIAYNGNICLAGRLHEFKVSEEICLPLVFMRVIKYKGGVDVELSFKDVPLFDIGCVMFSVQRYADSLSKRFHVEEFYGGLEPAVDVSTRYFTGNSLGPLS